MGPFKTSRLLGLFAIINKYTVTLKAAMHFPHQSIKNTRIIVREMKPLPIYCLNYIFLNANNGIFYRKSPFDPGIQVWLGDVEDALATKIASYTPRLFP